MSDGKTQRDFAPVVRMTGRILAIVLLVWLSHLALDWVMDQVKHLENASQIRFGLFAASLIVYVILMAIPFVPGVEIGISLMMLEGGAVAPFVYIATLLGLLLAYSIGLRTDGIVFKRVTNDLNLTRMSGLIDKIAPLDVDERLRLLNERLPKWVPPSVVRYRYVVLALLINLPGNSIIGGGGGLGLIAGFSGLYEKKATMLTFAIAVCPVPFMVYFLDLQPFG